MCKSLAWLSVNEAQGDVRISVSGEKSAFEESDSKILDKSDRDE